MQIGLYRLRPPCIWYHKTVPNTREGFSYILTRKGISRAGSGVGADVYCMQSQENWEYFEKGSIEGVSGVAGFIIFCDF